jgi:cysteine-rich repeat protein
MHCITNSCVRNACGDGVRAQEEECDDGDDRNEDGCDARCAIQIPGCTNGRVESGEECDDGNRDNADRCTNRCMKARCGDAIKATDEMCDDGNTREDDGCTQACKPSVDAGLSDAAVASDAAQAAPEASSDAVIEAGTGGDGSADGSLDANATSDTGAADAAPDAAHDARSAYDAGPECMACRQSTCSDYQGANLVSGCMVAVDTAWVTSGADPSFLQQCIDILACAQANDCAYNTAAGPLGCYCGTRSLDDCAKDGPANEAPCRNQWLAGSRTTANAEVLGNISNLEFPSAWAYYLLDCERDACKALCQ